MMTFGMLKQNVNRLLCLLLILFLGPPANALADYIAVKVPIANVRSGPDQSNTILWKVETYYPLYVIEKKGEWYHFKDFEEDEGWIHQSLVQRIETVITEKDDCNVRSGPSTGKDIVFTTEKGIPFRVLKKQGKWINVEHADGDRGWIHSALVWPDR